MDRLRLAVIDTGIDPAVYPFNKETHALVRFRSLLPFALEAVADPPGKRLSGRDAAEVLGEPPAGLAIQPSFERALDLSDGVILGHLEALSQRAPLSGALPTSGGSRGLLRDLVARAVAHGKGVYSFSRLDGPDLEDVRAEAARRGVPLVDPTVSRAEVTPLLRSLRGGAAGAILGRPLLHECPVLGVFGTSRAQGKFFAGMCDGAHLAFEMARQLEAGGERVALLAILDTWPVENSSHYPLVMLEALRRRLGPLRGRARLAWTARALGQHLRRLGCALAASLEGRPGGVAPPSDRRRWRARVWPGRDFVPPRYGGRITVLRVRRQPYWRLRDRSLGWAARSEAPVEIHVVPGVHENLLREPQVSALGRTLGDCLTAARRRAGVTPATREIAGCAVDGGGEGGLRGDLLQMSTARPA